MTVPTVANGFQLTYKMRVLTCNICRYGSEMLKFSFISANHTSRTFVIMNVPRLPC
jgi:hypothetical protein